MSNSYLVLVNAGDYCGNYVPHSYCETYEDALTSACDAVRLDKLLSRIIDLRTMQDVGLKIHKKTENGKPKLWLQMEL